ncbi:MAG: glycosyltransferase [Planctomycetaceae bacterium]
MFTALFVGSFVPLQGVPYLLDAAQLAPDLRFVIVGDGPDGARVEEEVARRGMPNVSLQRRFFAQEELASLYAEADAVLGVFGTSAKTARVIPCKVYDGLCAGLPVVTGDSRAARELLTDGRDALLVDRGDPRSLVRALRRLAGEPALGERLREGALRLARTRLSREAIGLRLQSALAAVVRA